jgi:PBP1b-binding outer membrane lipoprotein LpoB
MKTIILLFLLSLLILTACASKPSTTDEIQQCKDQIEKTFDTPNPLTDIKNCYLDCCEKSGQEKKDCDDVCHQIN